jgi:ribosomal protein S18 acetylase RimI-like enzyme
MKIRIAKESDADGILECVLSAYSHYVESLGFKPAPMLVDYKNLIRQADELIYVVEDDLNKVVGLLVLDISEEAFLLENIAVHKSTQGKGVGRTLLELSERIAIEKGHSCIELYTNELMTDNIRLYQAIGYQETHRMQQDGYNRVFFKKVLTV